MSVRPVRLQLSRAKGFNLQRLSLDTNGLRAINCARPGRHGNPYRIGAGVDRVQLRRWGWQFSPEGMEVACADAAEAVRRFWHALLWDEAIHDDVRRHVGGHNAACFCAATDPCHVDPILWLANSTAGEVDRIHRLIDEAILSESAALMEIAKR